MPEVPALALVVATVIPVVFVSVLSDVIVTPSDTPIAAPAMMLPLDRGAEVWKCPGSVTVDVAVCVCVGRVASAEPPVASTA